MFRLEKMDKNRWWAAAYITDDNGVHRAVHFDIESAAGIRVIARDDTIGCEDDSKETR